jgi:ABC-type antimicrobial peptide transport system permease subunit
LSEYKKSYSTDVVLEKYDFIANEAYLSASIDSVKLNSDSFITVNKVDAVNVEDFQYKLIVSDELYNQLHISVLATNYTELNVICISEEEKQQVSDFVSSVYSFYNSGELIANEENGYDVSIPADLKEVYLTLSAYSEYDNVLAPYLEEANRQVASRLLITLTILLLSMLIVFFSMKSYAIKNIYDIGVFRAIGINKRSIIFIYALQILIISLKSTLVGAIAYYLITSFVASIPIINVPIAMDFSIFSICTLGLMATNILVGVLPVIMYLQKTPSQLLSKYDI